MANQKAHRLRLLEYLGNPDNPWMNRTDLAKKILGYSKKESIYQMFTTAELDEVEKEALALRRKRYMSSLAKIDQAMIDRAISGDSQAAKLIYQRIEGWNEKIGINIDNIDKLIARELERVASGG